jgi:hypothetical protein
MTSPTQQDLYGVWGEAKGLTIYAVGANGTIVRLKHTAQPSPP